MESNLHARICFKLAVVVAALLCAILTVRAVKAQAPATQPALNNPEFIRAVEEARKSAANWSDSIKEFDKIQKALNTKQSETLRGLSGVQVFVEPLQQEVEEAGVTSALIKQDAELRLRRAGINVLSPEQDVNAPGDPVLEIQVRIFLGKEHFAGGHSSHVVIRLLQLVTLERDPNVTVLAPTWESMDSIGIGGNNNLRQLRDTAGDAVDQFANEYLAVNPKK